MTKCCVCLMRSLFVKLQLLSLPRLKKVEIEHSRLTWSEVDELLVLVRH
jgi:hypothetical protein